MKVELTKPAEVVKFDPIAITLTIESQEEYEAIREMAWHNVSIPNLIDTVHQPHVELFLTDLYSTITKDRD